MARKKYIKNEKGLVRAIATDSLQLEKPLVNENYDINVHNRNMDKIDSEIKKVNNLSSSNKSEIENLKGQVEGLELKAEKVTIADPTNKFKATNVEDALLENKTSILELEKTNGKLANLQTTNKTNLVAAINEVFQNANNGKDIIANAIGSPLVDSDTFSAMGTKIDTLTQTFQNTLTEKGVEVVEGDKMSTLIGKVGLLKKYNLPTWIDCDFWISGAKIPIGSVHSTASSVGNTVYVFCGSGAGAARMTFAYDCDNNIWEEKAPSGIDRFSATSSAIGSKIYLMGGRYSNYTRNSNSEYDCISNTWTSKSTLKTSKYGCASCSVGNEIYLIGGTDINNRQYKDNHSYDTITNTWTEKQSCDSVIYEVTSVFINNNIHVIGGGSINSGKNHNVYDVVSNTWTSKEEPIEPIAKGRTCVIDDMIHCIDTNSHQTYNVENGTWSIALPMLEKKSGFTLAEVDKRIYVIGGGDTDQVFKNNIYIS